MEKIQIVLKICIVLALFSCQEYRSKREDNNSASILIQKEMFSSLELKKWNIATKENILLQKKSCKDVKNRELLNEFMKFFQINEIQLEGKYTPRSSFFEYLRSSTIFEDSIEYNSIYIAEERLSGEKRHLINYLAIIEGNDVILLSFEHTRNGWKLKNKLNSDDAKIRSLFPQLNCATSECKTAFIGSNESLIISKFTPEKIESKVVVKTCKEYLQELHNFFKLELLES